MSRTPRSLGTPHGMLRLAPSLLAVSVALLVSTGCASGDGADGAACTPEPDVKTTICHPTEARRVITVDSCGNEIGGGLTCGSKYICIDLGKGANCGCPLMEPPVLGCLSSPTPGNESPATLSRMTTCDEVMPDVAETCLPGEICWYEWDDKGQLLNNGAAHCAASLIKAQKDSPFYAMSCEFPMYMHAPTTLMMDCRCNRSNAEMQACRPGADAWSNNLRLGSGPNMHGINLAKWGGGFVHEGELYAAVHYTGGGAKLKPGAIYAINLETGDRRVVSGAYLDPKTGRVDVGSGYTVDGEALPFLVDIELGKDGKIYAFGSDTLNHVEITRVDPKTGARELVWRRQYDADAGDANFPYGQCFSGRVDNAYAGGFAPVQYAERAYALGNDGSFYIGWKNDGVGVVNVSADGKTCTIVSRWASNNKTKPLPDVGGGLTPQYGTISGMLHYKGKVYAETKDMLIAIDDKTGDREAFAAVSGIGGVGETNFWVDEARGLFFACGTVAARKCSVHKLEDGNNAQGLFQIGMGMPVLPGKYPQVQGAKGALDNNNHNGFGAVGPDPKDPNILYFIVLSGVIKYEIDTGNSHFMSM